MKICTGLLAISFLSFSSLSYGWGEIGHAVVGEIAERNLTEEARELVFSIIGPEPLAVAANFADHVRSDARFKPFDNYHFCEIPEGVSEYQLKKSDQIIEKDAHAMLSQIPDRLIDPSFTRDQKIIWLKYLAHIVGDVHQPVHVGNGLDQGANFCQVTWINPATQQEEKANLHTVWDEKLFDVLSEKARQENMKKATPAKRYFGYAILVDQLIKDPTTKLAISKSDRERYMEAPVLDWYKEASTLHPIVYGDPERKVVKPRDRMFCAIDNRAIDPKEVPVLNQNYLDKAIPVLKLQLVKGGLRLASLLNAAAKKAQVAKVTATKTTDLIQSLQLFNAK